MQCIFLGTGMSVTSLKRQNTSLFLTDEDLNLLIDCNGNTVQSLLKAGFAFETLEHLYLTHHHPDHASSVDILVQQIWLKSCHYAIEKRIKPLNIYGCKRALDMARALIDLLNPQHMKDLFPIIFHELQDEGGELEIRGRQFKYFPVNHGKTPCYGIKTRHNDRTFLYTADTEPVPHVYKTLQDGDIMVHECNKVDSELCPNHTTLSQLKSYAPDLPDIDIYLVHLPDLGEDEERKLEKDLSEYQAPRFHLSHDGQVLNI